MKESVNASRFHSQRMPGSTYFENDRLDKKNLKAHQKMGHTIVYKNEPEKLKCILIRDVGKLEVAPDNTRNESHANGY